MVAVFSKLNSAEQDIMLKAPALITVLIGAADNNLDKKEKEWAVKLTKYRTFSSEPELLEYYKEVNKDFREMLDNLLRTLPDEHYKRNQAISSELEKLNSIFPKLDAEFASKFYASLLGFAKQVAESSGGVLRFSSISEAEKEWIDLKMIQAPSK